MGTFVRSSGASMRTGDWWLDHEESIFITIRRLYWLVIFARSRGISSFGPDPVDPGLCIFGLSAPNILKWIILNG